jgi:hypothetical protein
MMQRPLFIILLSLMTLPMIATKGLGQDPLYEEYFTGGTPDLEWESGYFDSLGNPLTPMLVDSVPGNPSGDDWVGVVEAYFVAHVGRGMAIAGERDLRDYSMEAEVWVDVSSDSYYEGIMIRMSQDTTSNIIEGYQLVSNFYPPYLYQQLKFRKFSSTMKGSRDLRIYTGDDIPGGVPTESGWHTFKIEAVGNQFWLYWDGIELPGNPQTDTTQVPLSSGRFGLYIFNQNFGQVMCDDIVVVSEGISLTGPDPGLTGMDNTLYAANATPGERVWFIYGLADGSTGVPGCPGAIVDIRNPVIIGFDEADLDGNASVTAWVPGAAGGRRVLFQAVEAANCRVSDLVEYTFP